MTGKSKTKKAEPTAAKLPAHKDPELMWKPGQSGNPKGRPKGSRNKLGEQFLDAMQRDFEEHGVAAIEIVRLERPHEYLKVIAGLMPKDVNLSVSATEAFERVMQALDKEADNGLADRISWQREKSGEVRH